jgi:GTP diphosphokinase / guanosine-3',5'-bis(diphosphate) 3'-diphosphatase
MKEEAQITPTAILRAAHTAAQWHATQRRKGKAAEPYVNHLIEVAFLVGNAGGSSDAVVAAYLHDAVEDQNIAPALIAELFGGYVAQLVMEVTDDKALPYATRKAEQVRTSAGKTPEAKLLKLADKISNVRSVTRDPPVDWSPERCRQYVSWCGEVVAGLRGTSPMLESAFDEAVKAAGFP